MNVINLQLHFFCYFSNASVIENHDKRMSLVFSKCLPLSAAHLFPCIMTTYSKSVMPIEGKIGFVEIIHVFLS